jgi:hypothetical protein
MKMRGNPGVGEEMVRVPEEIEWCIYVRGEPDSEFEGSNPDDVSEGNNVGEYDESGTPTPRGIPVSESGAFVIQYQKGMEFFRYQEIARDADGVFLVADNGDVTRILGGDEMFEDAGDLSLVRLEITTTNLEIVAQYDISRVPDASIAFGA